MKLTENQLECLEDLIYDLEEEETYEEGVLERAILRAQLDMLYMLQEIFEEK